MRYLGTAIVLLIVSVSATVADDRSALDQLEKSGGIIKRDESRNERPVDSVFLYLRSITDAENSSLKEIDRLPTFQFMGIGDSELKPETVRALQKKPSLKQLTISHARIGDEAARLLGTLKSLETLNLDAQLEIDPSALREILSLTGLKELTLSDRLVTEEILLELTKLPGLTSLTLKSVFVTDIGIASLRRLNHLHSLKLFLSSNVTDFGIQQLAELNLLSLEVTYLDATDARLRNLRKLNRLVSLRLINASKVTDDALPILIELTELKKLDLADARLSKSAIDSLKKSLSNCSIVQAPNRRT